MSVIWENQIGGPFCCWLPGTRNPCWLLLSSSPNQILKEGQSWRKECWNSTARTMSTILKSFSRVQKHGVLCLKIEVSFGKASQLKMVNIEKFRFYFVYFQHTIEEILSRGNGLFHISWCHYPITIKDISISMIWLSTLYLVWNETQKYIWLRV